MQKLITPVEGIKFSPVSVCRLYDYLNDTTVEMWAGRVGGSGGCSTYLALTYQTSIKREFLIFVFDVKSCFFNLQKHFWR